MNTYDTEMATPDVMLGGRACYTRRALAKALGKSEQTLAGWSTRGFGPPYLLIGRRVVYPEDQFMRWLDTKLVEPEAKGMLSTANGKLEVRNGLRRN